jgi:hypothetical protein
MKKSISFIICCLLLNTNIFANMNSSSKSNNMSNYHTGFYSKTNRIVNTVLLVDDIQKQVSEIGDVKVLNGWNCGSAIVTANMHGSIITIETEFCSMAPKSVNEAAAVALANDMAKKIEK